MYRKRMSEALQEARAYTAVNEVMVFKGGRGMNVSKQDLPVFKAKGWKLKEELEEANMKRILQALQDKLSKEGGAAGFDDLKKTAKSMGLDLTPQMLKNMPGIKQHRDGDYILEELEEQKRELMLTYGKPGEKVKAYYTMFMQDLQNKASELRKKGFVVDKMGRTQPMSQLRDRIPEELDVDNMTEEQLDEALDVKWDSNKQGWFDRQGRRRYLGVMATNKLMAKALDKAKKTGDFINPYKLKHGQRPEETDLEEGIKPYVSMQRDSKTNKMNYVVLDKDEKEVYRSSDERLATAYLRKNFNKLREELEEAFTKKDFQKLETTNDHTEAAKKLINMFGTAQEKKTMADIERRHEKTGYISGTDYKMRQIMVNKYYSRLS